MPVLVRDLSMSDLTDDLIIAYNYWRDIKGAKVGPSLRAFDLLRLPSKRLPSTLVFDCIDAGQSFRFRYYGRAFAEIHGVDLTGKEPHDVQQPDLSNHVVSELGRIVSTASPNFSIYTYHGARGFEEFQAVLRLPLSDDGVTVAHIVSVVELNRDPNWFREFIYSNGNGL
jgi:hypothetical protein